MWRNLCLAFDELRIYSNSIWDIPLFFYDTHFLCKKNHLQFKFPLLMKVDFSVPYTQSHCITQNLWVNTRKFFKLKFNYWSNRHVPNVRFNLFIWHNFTPESNRNAIVGNALAKMWEHFDYKYFKQFESFPKYWFNNKRARIL